MDARYIYLASDPVAKGWVAALEHAEHTQIAIHYLPNHLFEQRTYAGEERTKGYTTASNPNGRARY
jgi:hypothetical protein